MFNLLLKIDKTWDFLVEPPNINHWKNFFLIHILEKTLLVFPRWVPNIHLVEFQPNRRFCYDLIRAPCAPGSWIVLKKMACGQLRNVQRYQKHVPLVRWFIFRVSYMFKPTVGTATIIKQHWSMKFKWKDKQIWNNNLDI